VRVDYRRDPALREGWWNWGGITRQVSLVARGPVVLHDAGLLPRRVCVESTCAWNVLVDGWLENRSAAVQQPAVAVRLQSPDGVVSEGSAPAPRALRPGERVRVRFGVAIEGEARTWSPERPDRYAATIATHAGGRVVQVDQRRIGLRTVDVSDGMLRLNDRVLDLRGASIQEDVPGRGPAMTDADIDNAVDELKALGVNITRAHYLLDPRLLDRLDEAGILVWSQAPVYHRDRQLKTPGQRSHELDVVRATILAARNHPSVITHSVANELTSQPDRHRTSRVWMTNAAALARDLDPTLPVSIDILSYPGIGRQTTYDAFDMLGINSYYGWYAGKSNRSTADLDDLAPYLRAMRGGDRARTGRRQADLRLPGAVPQAQPRHRRPAGLHGRGDLLDRARVRGQAALGRRRAPAPAGARLVSPQGADRLRRQDQARLRRREARLRGDALVPRRPCRGGPGRARRRRLVRAARAALPRGLRLRRCAHRARRVVPARHLARLAPARLGPGRRAADAARGVADIARRGTTHHLVAL
jgi:hypothetical protein